MNKAVGRVLVMTVGTGNTEQLEETLIRPLKKSIETGEWSQIVLLPSRKTKEFAIRLTTELPGEVVTIEELPDGDENNADSAYAHFDYVLGQLLQDREPGHIEVDFTRGTKAMSAALVLAATRRGIPRLRYIIGERDQSGMVVPGTEVVRGIRTTTIDGHRRLDLARNLFKRGNFAAVLEILPDPLSDFAKIYPSEVRQVSGAVRSAAEFFSAWDRLDYAGAAKVVVQPDAPEGWRNVWPDRKMVCWVKNLAGMMNSFHNRSGPVKKAECPTMATHLRRQIVDLIANAERRYRSDQLEDTYIRLYRVLELIGQARMFDHGLDTAFLDPDHPTIAKFAQDLEKGRSAIPLTSDKMGYYRSPLDKTQRILGRLKDDMAEELRAFLRSGDFQAQIRNKSILIHGFEAQASSVSTSIEQIIQKLVSLAESDGGEAFHAALQVARSPAFDS